MVAIPDLHFLLDRDRQHPQPSRDFPWSSPLRLTYLLYMGPTPVLPSLGLVSLA